MGDQNLLDFKNLFFAGHSDLQITPNKLAFFLFCSSFFLSQVTETVLAVPAVWAAAAVLGVARAPRVATSIMGLATMPTLTR